MRSSPKVVLKPQQVQVASAQVIEDSSSSKHEETILTQAQAQASRILEKAELQADALLAEARTRYEEAERRGYNAGLAQGEQATSERVRAAAHLVDQMLRAREDFLHRCEREAIELGLEIAEKVIGRESSLDRSVVADIARRAIERACTGEACSLHLNPADSEFVREHLSRHLSNVGWEIVADYRIQEGDCVITTAHGQVDARISSQLNEIHNTLLGESEPHDG